MPVPKPVPLIDLYFEWLAIQIVRDRMLAFERAGQSFWSSTPPLAKEHYAPRPSRPLTVKVAVRLMRQAEADAAAAWEDWAPRGTKFDAA